MITTIITGRPASGKTSYALDLILRLEKKKILYWNLECADSEYLRKKYPLAFSRPNTSHLNNNDPQNFFESLAKSEFDIVVIDYIELLNVKNMLAFLKEIKNIESLFILSQLRRDGTHFEYPAAEIKTIQKAD